MRELQQLYHIVLKSPLGARAGTLRLLRREAVLTLLGIENHLTCVSQNGQTMEMSGALRTPMRELLCTLYARIEEDGITGSIEGLRLHLPFVGKREQ